MIWRGWGLDLKYALRALSSKPGTTFTVIATIAVAIGATTAVYSVVDGVLLRPLPYPEPDRLARIHQTSKSFEERFGIGQFNPQAPVYYRWLEADTGFESLGAYVDASFVLRGSESAEVLKGQEASSGFFKVLGVLPILGRGIESADDAADAPPVVVLGEALWRERFGGSSDALGAAFVLDGTPHSIVGVMPAGFQGPQDTGSVGDLMLPGGPPLLWTPLTAEARRGWKNVSVIGRVDEGLSLRAAEQRFAAVHANLVAENLDPQGDTGVLVSSLLDSLVSGVNTTLWFLLGSVALVLVVATVNIANILTALGLNRRRELAVRAALGAGSGRLVRSMLVHSTVLALLGGLGGIAVAWISLPLLLSFLPPTVPRQELIGINAGVLLCGVVLTAVTALFVGSLPAILAARTDPQQAMRAATRSFTSGRAAGRVRSALVVAEVALAFVLLIGAGLLGGSYARLMSVERGFDTGGLAAIRVQPTGESYRNRDQFTRTLRDRLEQIPGVSAVAANNLPLTGLTAGTTLYLERAASEPEEITALVTAGQENYFDVLGIPILAGRGFGPSDNRESPPVAIVNETMARRYWPDSDAVGRRLKTFDDDSFWVEIVGIAADVRHEGLSTPAEPTVFLPAAQSKRDTNEWILRVRRGDTSAVIQQARAVVASVSPTTPVSRTLILEETIARSVAVPRFRTFFIVGLAGLAAILALLGVYGVLAFAVGQRTKEIGIRMALGARAHNVLTNIVGAGLKLALAGIAAGLLVAWSASGVIRSFLFEVTPNDPGTYFVVVAGLLAVTCLAAYLPARRAAAVNPAKVLNGD
jgi:putative ABC transport system permease protein